MDTEAPVIEHLRELRARIIISAAAILLGSVAGFLLYDAILAFFSAPFRGLDQVLDNTFYIHSIFEGFTVKIRLSVVAGVTFSFPVHLYNIVRFVFPGLTTRERRIVTATICSGAVLAVLAFYYGYVHMIPISVRFLTGIGFIPPDVGLLLGYGRNVFYVLQILLLLLLLVQVPVLLEILMVLNVVKRKTLLRAWRYVLMAIFPLAALFTPPDFVSQLTVAIPLIALFFLTILIARIFHFGEG